MISVDYRVENNVGKEENPDYQHVLLFPQNVFETSLFQGH